jgi:hypothetical protein
MIGLGSSRGLSLFCLIVYHLRMRHFTLLLLVLLASLLVLFDAFWSRPRAVRAQSAALKVYVQQVKDKRWTDIQGTEIVGFSCINEVASNAVCFVASR